MLENWLQFTLPSPTSLPLCLSQAPFFVLYPDKADGLEIHLDPFSSGKWLSCRSRVSSAFVFPKNMISLLVKWNVNKISENNLLPAWWQQANMMPVNKSCCFYHKVVVPRARQYFYGSSTKWQFPPAYFYLAFPTKLLIAFLPSIIGNSCVEPPIFDYFFLQKVPFFKVCLYGCSLQAWQKRGKTNIGKMANHSENSVPVGKHAYEHMLLYSEQWHS